MNALEEQALLSVRAVVALCVVALASSAPALAAPADPGADAMTLEAGRLLYIEGKRSSGAPLVARRAGGITISGAEAACVNCHRRSGFGSFEGRSYIPPVNAASLFAAQRPGTGASASGIGRPAYTSHTLAGAIRAGIDPSGRRLEYLMPRYDLTDAEMASLTAYLRQLSTRDAADVDAKVLDFATVVAPGVAPTRSKAVLDVLHACFAEHNAGPPPARGRKRLSADVSLSEQPKWKLHVWELHGRPETWSAQLADYARRQPVFAMVGGAGGGNWAPVHEFCERNGLPCLFPSVEVPVADETGFYPLYLSRGLLLEAAIVARHLAEQAGAVKRVVQVLRADDEGARAAAAALRRHLVLQGVATQERHLAASAAIDARAVAAAPADALVLWLRADDLSRLDAVNPHSGLVYLSAMLADPEQAPLPAAWKTRVLLASPYELPQKRAARTAQLHTWLRAQALSPVDESAQTDALIACSALGTGMNAIAAHLHRDYLVERLETVTGRGGYSGQYPGLSLGAGQRFASKSGYLVRFAGAQDTRMVPVGERMAP